MEAGKTTDIWWRNGIAIPRNTEHAVTSGLKDQVDATFEDGFAGDDVLDSSVTSKASGDT